MAKYALSAILGLVTKDYDKKIKDSESKGKAFGLSLKTAVKAGAAAAAAALVAFAAAGVKNFMEMEKKAKEVFTLIPDASKKQKDKLVADAKSISNAFGRDVTQVLDGMYQAISAGIPQNNILKFMETASNAAQGGVAKLDDAVGAITTVLNGYNMKADQAENVSDALFTTVKLGVTDFTELGQNIGKVTPLAAALGVEFDEVAGMFASLTKTLGKGQTAVAGTQIKAMLAELSSESQKAGKAFKDLTGLAFTDFIKKGGDMQGALRLLDKGAKDSGKSVKDLFGSIQGGMGALALANNDAQDLGNTMEEMGKKMGATKKAADEVGESMSVKMDKAMQKVKNAGIDLGGALVKLGGGNGILEMVVGAVDKGVKIFIEFTKEGTLLDKIMGVLAITIKQTIKTIGSIVLAFGNGVNAITLVIKIAEELIMTLVDMGKNAFKPVVQAMDSFILALKAMGKVLADPFNVDAWGDAKDMMAKAMSDMVDSVGNWGDDFASSFDKRSKNIEGHWDKFSKQNKKFVDETIDLWNEEGDWAFLDPQKLAKAEKEIQKGAKAVGEMAKEQEKAKKLTEEQAKKAREVEEEVRKQMAAQKIIVAEKKAEEIVSKNQKAREEAIKTLMEKKKELAEALKKRQEEINKALQKSSELHKGAAGLATELLKSTKMTAEEKKRLEKVQRQLQHMAEREHDATEAGMKALKERKKQIEAIKAAELKILEAELKRKGLKPKEIAEAMKRHKFSKAIAEEEALINKRIGQAEAIQKRFNKTIPPATKELKAVEKAAQAIPKPLDKAQVTQALLAGETVDVEEGMEEVNRQSSELNDNLRYASMSASDLKDALNDIDVNMDGTKEFPENVELASKKMDEFNKKAADNELLKLVGGKAIKINQNSPVPVKFDKKGMNMGIDKQTIQQMQNNWKSAFTNWKTTNQHLSTINKTLKGYFVNQ